MRQIVKTIFLILGKIALGLAILTFGLWFLLNTTLGANVVFQTLSWLTPWSIQYQALEGSLLSSLRFFDLSVRSSTIVLTTQRLHIDWDFQSLLRGTLHIRDLTAQRVSIEPQITESHPKTQFTLSEIRTQMHEAFPFPLRIDNFLATNVEIKTKKSILLNHFSFTSANTRNSFILKNLTLEGSFGQIKLEADQEFHAQWNIAIPDLSLWWNDLKGDFHSIGTLDIRDIEQPLDSTTMELEASSQSLIWNNLPLKQLKIHHKGALKKPALSFEGTVKDHFIKTNITGEYKKDGWVIQANPVYWKHPKYGVLPEAELNFTLKDQKKYTGTIEVLFAKNKIFGNYAINPNQTHAIEGLLQGNFEDLSFLSKFSDDLKKLNGHIHTTLHLGGHLHKPKFWGESTLTKTHIPLPALGTEIKLHQLHFHSNGDGILTIAGDGKLGTGDFTLKGHSNFLNNDPQMDLALTGKDLLVSKTREYAIWANPHLRIQIKNGTPEITGNIFIPKANISIQSKHNYIGTSSDVIIVKNKQSLTPVEKPHPLQQFKTRVTLELGENVHFNGYGLDSNFVGKVNVSGEQGKPWLGSGKLNLKNGKFKARNRVLNLTKGQIFYAETPLINPALDIRAQREVKPIAHQTSTRDLFGPYEMPVEKLTVGVALTGTLKSPHIRLYAQPSMPEGDILSYLILDKPQKAASFTEGKILFEAASEMMHQFGLQKHDIRPSLVEKFHLDTLDLKTASSRDPSKSLLEDTVLVVGKQISDRLYAEYSVGLMDKASTLSLRYLVGKHITLETQASKNSVSADILFIFESG